MLPTSKILPFTLVMSCALVTGASAVLHAGDLELIQKTTVYEKALTFAVGPAAKFSNTVNGRTHQQTPLTTYRGYQYVTFYDAQRRVCIGRRKLSKKAWDVIHFNDHKFKTNDSHNTTVIGICDKDGTIHMAFDHHATPLNYRVSKIGAAHDPDSIDWNADLFGGVSHSLGSVEANEQVTYPRFFSAPNGNLMLFYRSVTSGNGDGMLEEYDGNKHDWTAGMGKVIARDIGTYTFKGKTSGLRCPYMNSVSYAGNRLHMSWVWRDRFERTDPKHQHDLCYTYSDDHGRTWFNSDGKRIGKMGEDYIHLNSEGLVVAPIPSHSRLTNSNTHYAYADGSIHVVMRRHVSDVSESRFVHYWRTADGKWDEQVLPFYGGRPKLVGSTDGSFILAYEEESQLYVVTGKPNADQTAWDWRQAKLPGAISCYGEAVLDLERWEQEEILSLYCQSAPAREIQTEQSAAIDGLPSALHVLDFKVTRPVRPPAGRLAIVADGNSPDPDDLGATAVMFGLLKAAGLGDRLVHLSHSCDLKPVARISAEDEQRRQQVLHQLCADGITHFGPFKNLTRYINCRTQQDLAVQDLCEAINASSADDPLWIIEAGEPDVIGYALQAASPDRRKHVHVVSHHPANDNSGDFFEWGQILEFGVKEHQIGDQNVGLQTAIAPWDWAKDHANPGIKWIWKQLEYAEQDGVVKFQDNKFDCSDAGMIYWWITGADRGGNAVATPLEIKKMLLSE